MVRPQVHYSPLVGAGCYTWIVGSAGWNVLAAQLHGSFKDMDFSFPFFYYFSITAGLCFQYHDVFMIAFPLSRFHYIHVCGGW